MYISFRNQRLCLQSGKKIKLLFRFPWREASLFKPLKHTTPSE